MSDISPGQFANRDDIDEADDTPSVLLDREADQILAEDRAIPTSTADDLGLLDAEPTYGAQEQTSDPTPDHGFAAPPIRQSLRSDGEAAREWATSNQARLEEAIREQPVRATIYALGLGVVIGLLIAR